MTVHRVGFHTGIEVDDVIFGIYVVVTCGCADVPLEHAAVGALIDTTVGQHRNREGVDVVRVLVEKRVLVADGRGRHGAVCFCLVGVVLDEVFLGGRCVLYTAEERELDFLDGLVGEDTGQTEVVHAKLHVVVLQLVHDVEGRIVAGVEFSRVKCARGVHRIGVGVDVEVALDFAGHHVSFASECAWSFLFAERCVADEVERHLVGNVEV